MNYERIQFFLESIYFVWYLCFGLLHYTCDSFASLFLSHCYRHFNRLALFKRHFYASKNELHYNSKSNIECFSTGFANDKSQYMYKSLPVKTKTAFLSRKIILLAILLYGQFIQYTQIS